MFFTTLEHWKALLEAGHTIPPTIPTFWFDQLKELHARRYLHPRTHLPSSTVLRDEVLPAYNAVAFERIMRVTPTQFQILLDLIRDHPVFHSANPLRPQAPVRVQLTVALYRLGSRGISTYKTAFTMGVGQGSVDLFTRRCIEAIECMEERLIVWPNYERKHEIKRWFKYAKNFPNCIGVVDGVHFPFESAPAYD
ncbi:MAG: hypothetical protein J3R72DRAFT_367884, partial [Linnemannia gamsii]